MINGHDAPPAAPTEADREQERERLQRMADAIEAMIRRHHQAVEQRRRRETAS